jgi:hypothetical protein
MPTERTGSILRGFLRISKRIFKILPIILLGIGLGSGVTATSQAFEAPSIDESQAKAAFIFNFTMFATWPEGSFSKDPSSLVIGVMGADQIGAALKTLEGEKIRERSVKVEKFSGLEKIKTYHVLYIDAS